MTFLCPYCLRPVVPPLKMTHVLNQYFNFILNHPNCSRHSIELALYGHRLGISSKTVASNIHNLSLRLIGTGFALIYHGNNRHRTYSIVLTSTFKTQENESVVNGTVQLNPSLS